MAGLSKEEIEDLRRHLEAMLTLSMMSFHEAAAVALKQIAMIQYDLQWNEPPAPPVDDDPFAGWDIVEDWERAWGN